MGAVSQFGEEAALVKNSALRADDGLLVGAQHLSVGPLQGGLVPLGRHVYERALWPQDAEVIWYLFLWTASDVTAK